MPRRRQLPNRLPPDSGSWPYGWQWPAEGFWIDQGQEWMPADGCLVKLAEIDEIYVLALTVFLVTETQQIRSQYEHWLKDKGMNAMPMDGTTRDWLRTTVFWQTLAPRAREAVDHLA